MRGRIADEWGAPSSCNLARQHGMLRLPGHSPTGFLLTVLPPIWQQLLITVTSGESTGAHSIMSNATVMRRRHTGGSMQAARSAIRVGKRVKMKSCVWAVEGAQALTDRDGTPQRFGPAMLTAVLVPECSGRSLAEDGHGCWAESPTAWAAVPRDKLERAASDSRSQT